MNFVIADGHTATGNYGCGAVDFLDESNCVREIGPLVCEYLEKEGQVTTHLRIDKSNSYNYEDCYVRADQANRTNADWYIELHLNSGKNRTGDGSEICVFNDNPEVMEMASRISENISRTLKIDDRGVKKENLIVLKRTKMKALLIECMFVDCDNPNKYNEKIIAKAIAEGILNITISDELVYGWNKRGDRWFYCTDVLNKYYYASVWKFIDGKWYLFDSDGWCITGWVYYQTCKDKKDVWYYLDKGSCQLGIGWKEINNEWYFFNNDGEMQTGWIKDNGKDYCLFSSGEIIHDCEMYGYRFDSNGMATKIE